MARRARATAAALWAFHAAPCAALLLGCALAAQTPAGWHRVLYLHGGPALDEQVAAQIRALGFGAVSVSPGADPARIADLQLAPFGDQLVGKGVLELRPAQWDEVRHAYLRERDPSLLIRPAVLADADVQLDLERTLVHRLREFATAPREPVALTLGDEISLTRHGNPLDLCFAEPTLREFRRWLQVRHGTLETLNRAWGTQFPTWDSVLPFTADQIRARELAGAELPRNLRPWAEHREFMDLELARTVALLCRRAEAEHPSLPVGLTGLQPPSAYGGHDYARLLPQLDLYEAYDIGGARQLAMSLARPDAAQWVTLFPPEGAEPAELPGARAAEALARGAHGLVVWSSGHLFDAERQPNEHARRLAATFRELETPAHWFAGARWLPSPVLLVESQASIRAHWMLDSADDGATWINRLSSYEAAHSTSQAARRSWVLLLQDLGLQPELIGEASLPERLRRDAPKVLVLPAQLALGDAAVHAIAAYVEQGGALIADHGAALYDEHLVRRREAGLDELFGLRGRSARWEHLRVAQGRGLGDGRTAEAGIRGLLGEGDPQGSIQIEHAAGKGRTLYLNLPVCEYAARRLAPQSHAFCVDLRQRVGWAMSEAGVTPPLSVRGQGLPTCVERIRLRARDGTELLAVRLHVLDEPALACRLAEAGPHRVELTFDAPVRLRDLRRREDLGVARSFTVTLDPWLGAFFAVDRQP